LWGGGAHYGGYYQSADWDAFYNQYGQVVWVCRELATGGFTYKATTDLRWRGPIYY